MKLTERQSQLLDLLLRGLPDKAIAAELGICYGTVRKHLESMFRKFRVQTRIGLAVAYTTARGEILATSLVAKSPTGKSTRGRR